MTLALIPRAPASVAHYPPGATFGPRSLIDYEFVWLLSGSARWHGGGCAVSLRPGTLLLASQGIEDRIEWDPLLTTAHAYVHFTIPDPGLLPDQRHWPLTRPLTATSPLTGLCRYLLLLAVLPGPEATTRTGAVLGWILELFVADPLPGADEIGPLPENLARMVRQVQATWRERGVSAIPLDALAASAGVSPGHLSRLFRQRYAVGPVAAVELIRLARAATLLQRSNLPVSAVSGSCGYVNPFHFSHRFTKVYGVSPRTYRTDLGGADPIAPLISAGLLPLASRLLLEEV